MSEEASGYSISAAKLQASKCTVLDEAEAVAAVKSGKGLVWLHVQVIEREPAFAFLTQELGFNELHAEDALSDQERPAAHEGDDTLFMVAPAVHASDLGFHYVEIAIFVGKSFIVTVATEESPLIAEWMERWKKSPQLVGRTAPLLLHSLLDAIVDDYFPAADALEDDVDRLEERIYRGRSNIVTEALRVKRSLLQARRQITPIRDVLNALLRRDVALIPAEIKPHFQDVYDHTIRIAETIDITRDILGSIVDAHLSLVSNKLNEVMRFMTVIATILMSLSLIAGIYGMNFRLMPELEWRWGYAFALGLMLLVALIEYAIFKKKGWLTTRGVERTFRMRDRR